MVAVAAGQRPEVVPRRRSVALGGSSGGRLASAIEISSLRPGQVERGRQRWW